MQDVPIVMNLFDTRKVDTSSEHFEQLLTGSRFRLERIVSTGHATPDDQWYDQSNMEWVALLQGEAELRFRLNKGDQLMALKAGDYLQIPPHLKHCVTFTSSHPQAVWLALHLE